MSAGRHVREQQTRYRRVEVRLFGDERFRALGPLKPSGQALWLYLLLGPCTTNVPGIIVAGEAALAEALGWTRAALRACWAEIAAQGMAEADWSARLIWLPNGVKYNAPANPNVVKSWRPTLAEVPECGLKRKAIDSLIRFLQPFGEPFAQPLRESFGESGSGAGTGSGTGVARAEPLAEPSPPEAGPSKGGIGLAEGVEPHRPSEPPGLGRSLPGVDTEAPPPDAQEAQAAAAHRLELAIGCSFKQAHGAILGLCAAGAAMPWIEARIAASVGTSPPPWEWSKAAKAARAVEIGASKPAHVFRPAVPSRYL